MFIYLFSWISFRFLWYFCVLSHLTIVLAVLVSRFCGFIHVGMWQSRERWLPTSSFLYLTILFWLNSPFHSERLISFEKEFTFYTWRLFYLFAHRSQLSHYLLSHHLANAKWMALFEFFFYLNLPVLKRISWRGDSSICWNNL